MSITVADCLQLASLREAQLVGGRGGLDKIVSCVSVLEYADLTALEDQLFLGNELIITAFVSVKDDVAAQCSALRRLHEAGEVGLVLYYVGIYVPALDEKLIDMANELAFPLIVMPPNRYNLRYSEVIADVMNAIFIDQKQEIDIVKGVLDRIAQLKERQRTHSVVMRVLSDRLRCSLLIVDRKQSPISLAAWPQALDWSNADFTGLIELFYKDADAHEPQKVDIEDRNVSVLRLPFDTEKQKGLTLYAISDGNELDAATLRQAVEVLQLSERIWNIGFASEDYDALVRAILANQPGEMRRIAIQLRVNIDAISMMWILYDRKVRDVEDRRAVNERLMARTLRFLKETHAVVLVDAFENCVVGFTDMPKFNAGVEDLCAQFSKSLEQIYPELVLVNCQRLKTTGEVRNVYTMVEMHINTACRLFPLQRVLSEREFIFAGKCAAIMEQGEEAVNRYMVILKPLIDEEGGREIIETLACYLLDFQGNTQKTAYHLFVHKNTVKYRLKKAAAALGHEVTKTPELLDLYTAIALDRLMQS